MLRLWGGSVWGGCGVLAVVRADFPLFGRLLEFAAQATQLGLL